jgi:O-antigen/teichoic acid export membrane protein
MIHKIKSIASVIGLDKAIFFTSFSNIINAFGSVISVLLVVKFLSGVEQGFYYTFGSIVAIQIFFELGLNGIITQYVAHETSNLRWEGEVLLGESKYQSRLSSLLHFSVKWYLTFAGMLLFSLIIVGMVFFKRYSTASVEVSWAVPWLLLAIGTGFNLILSPVIAFVQGLGKVKEIAKILLVAQTIRLGVIWGGLILGAKLYVLGMGSLVTVFLCLIMIFIKYRIILTNIWRTVIVEKVRYRQEIFPYQWKIALSWISGYFIFQLFNPVLFATQGAAVAGQMGMTLAALNGVLSISLVWITTKVPLFSGLIAQNEYIKLDHIFNKTLKQSALINLSGLLMVIIIIYFIRNYNISISGKPLGNRFIDYTPMLLMMLPIFLNQIVASWATYLRCHKKEPFLYNSIASGILCSLSTVILGRLYGVMGVTFGYFCINIILFPWAYLIYKTKKSEWHSIA